MRSSVLGSLGLGIVSVIALSASAHADGIPVPERYNPEKHGLKLTNVVFDRAPIFPQDGIYKSGRDQLVLDGFELSTQGRFAMAFGVTIAVSGSESSDAKIGFKMETENLLDGRYYSKSDGKIKRFGSHQTVTLESGEKVNYELIGIVTQNELTALELNFPILKRTEKGTLRYTGKQQHIKIVSAAESSGQRLGTTGRSLKNGSFFPPFRAIDTLDLELVASMSDEFRASQLNRRKWATDYFGNPAENQFIEDGILHVVIDENGPAPTPWGVKSTVRSRFAQKYGYFELRARLPGKSGGLPAFWLWPKEPVAHELAEEEIDIFENGGPNWLLLNAYAGPNHPKKWGESTRVHFPNVDFTKEFHTFAVDWTPDGITWLVDDQIVNQSEYSPRSPMFILMDGQVAEGAWHHIVPIDLPQDMEIEYVRAYRHKKLE
jgi:hypothetical protein